LADKPLSQFLATYTGNTRVAARSALLLFFDYVHDRTERDTKQRRRVTEEVMAEYDRLAAAYIANGQNVVYDVQGFIRFMEERGMQPKTCSPYKNWVMTWLTMADVEIKRSQARLITSKTPYPEVMTESTVLSHDLIATILARGDPPLHLKALILVLASSGMRLGEALSLTADDIDFAASPVTISVRRSVGRRTPKSGQRRITFCTSEAAAVLQEWMDQRDTWLANKLRAIEIRKTTILNYDRIQKDPAKEFRVFPISRQDAAKTFYTAVERATGQAFLDGTTGRHQIHLHSFRSYFNTTLKRAGGNADVIAEQLIGHRGYLGGVYDKIGIEEKAALYAANEHLLWILQEQPPAPDVVAEAAALRERLADQDLRMAQMERQIAEVAGRTLDEWERLRKERGLDK